MRSIWQYFKDYIGEQHPVHLLVVLAYTAVAIVLNYRYDIENGIIDRHHGTLKHLYLYFLLYAAAMVPAYLSYAYSREGRKMLSDIRLWIRIFLALLIFCIYCYFYQYREWISPFFDSYAVKTIIRICADQVFQSTLMFLLIVLFWWFSDRKERPLYGFKVKGVNMRPYLWMMAGMVPLIIAASFSTDFQNYYPTARRIVNLCTESMPTWAYVTLYEICYGSEFFHIEFFFRGFLILAFVRYAGSKAILPAAVFYCFVHFGKPAGECISSLFGGIILGVLSYRTRSIAAGVLVHLGIAMLMELVAGIWMLYK